MVAADNSASFPTSSYRIDPRKALIAASLCWLGFAMMVWAVETGHITAIDKAGLLFWRDSDLRPVGPTRLLETVRDVTALGGTLLRNLFALCAVVALLFLKLRREAALLALTVIGGLIANSAAKVLFGRPRPEIVPHLTEAGGMSFPSGHSFNSAAVYIAMALAFAALSPRQSVRMTVIGGAVLASMAIAWSRVWLGVHWPSDVIAGWLGGAGWAFAASALLYRPAQMTADRLEHD
ncbi:phosphatase PAP2 family protein [Novosphingobium pentaromativorans]|uniref:Phosphoesterase, PA-phosphatase related protein n=1 Tax=Novosphingobium pentaromativorans US6-1 TaxID=1088721 RepID=G6EHP6_9SPHN|nr:phosphatase PAP2 family protein [Novosphingobium pentaromativorans]AIT78542.1 PA-phosphatase [Novosphingobium pentaromativorans US6-1]EHJ59206.1 phosphoesterase, PA-phosphatase related protein [Novosphingobium pentaromativorans US6-1]